MRLFHSITSVGGTTSFGPEVAASFSSGGFSNVFARPSYQDDAVTNYLNDLGKVNKGLFNSSGRAFPDIAAQAQHFQVVRGGKTISVSGTSAASPSVGGLVALLNDALFSKGGSPLGFMNPILYKLGSGVLNDITEGNNPGCGTNGFAAAEGWDPVRTHPSIRFTHNALNTHDAGHWARNSRLFEASKCPQSTLLGSDTWHRGLRSARRSHFAAGAYGSMFTTCHTFFFHNGWNIIPRMKLNICANPSSS